MRGIIIFSHDFIHASIIIVIMMILVIRWRNIFFLLVLVHSDPQHERNKKNPKGIYVDYDFVYDIQGTVVKMDPAQ